MIGTNDVRSTDSSLDVTAFVDQMIADMNELIERAQTESPNTKILLSTIPPIVTFGNNAVSTIAQRIQEFNSRLPGFVQDQVALGRNVTFVNAGGSLTEDALLGDGYHLNAEGLIQLGNAWYEALVQEEQISGISNLTGSEFDDRITGSGGANTLNGGAGDDWLSGTTAVLAGANEQDVLIGGVGSDRFILGDSLQAYYTANGDNDHVVIQDFDTNVDVVQLHGTSSDYVQQQIGSDLYLRLSGSNELIAIFSNTSNLNLSSSGFDFA